MSGLDIDLVACLGDFIGYGPKPKECFHIIQHICQIMLEGNHEAAVLTPYEKNKQNINEFALAGILYTQSQLEKEQIFLLNTLPLFQTFGELLSFGHASVIESKIWDYVDSEDSIFQQIRQMKTRIGFIGHTHQPFVYNDLQRGVRDFVDEENFFDLSDNSRYLINVGSVGQPRDSDHRACYAILEIEQEKVFLRIRKVKYDHLATAQEIIRVGLPKALGDRLKYGR